MEFLRRVLISSVMFFGCAVFAFSEETANVDDLFSVQDGTVAGDSAGNTAGPVTDVEDQPEIGIDANALMTDDPSFSGSVQLGGGFLVGIHQWPAGSSGAQEWLDAAAGQVDAGALADMTVAVQFDVRPQNWLRLFVSLETELDPTEMTYSTPAFDEIFVDYTFRQNWLFRVGRYGMTWGQGHLLDNPANLLRGADSGTAVRMISPLAGGEVQAVVYGTEDWFAAAPTVGAQTLAYVLGWNGVAADTAIGAAARYRHEDDYAVQCSLSGKRAFAGIDTALEGLVRWDSTQVLNADSLQAAAMVNLFGEIGSPVWKIMLEYQYVWPSTGALSGEAPGHSSGLAIQAPVFLGWTPAIRWLHAFDDMSGEFIPGISRKIAPNVRMSIGLPLLYGGQNSSFLTSQDDEEDELMPEADDFRQEYSGALVMKLSLSFSF